MDDKTYTMLNIGNDDSAQTKRNIPKEVKALEVSGINASNATSYSDAIKDVKLAKLSISDITVNKSWIRNVIRSCTTLQELNINTDFSIHEFHPLLIEIDQHPSLVKLNIQMKKVLDEENWYIDAWEKFTTFNKSLLYAKFCILEINREDSLLRSFDVQNNKCTLRNDVKLTPILVNWLEYKYPGSDFWRNISHEDSNSYSLGPSSNPRTGLISAFREQHNSIYLASLKPLPYVVAFLSLLAFGGFFAGCLTSIPKDEEMNAQGGVFLAASILSAIIGFACLLVAESKVVPSFIAKCRPNPRTFEYDAEVQNSIV